LPSFKNDDIIKWIQINLKASLGISFQESNKIIHCLPGAVSEVLAKGHRDFYNNVGKGNDRKAKGFEHQN